MSTSRSAIEKPREAPSEAPLTDPASADRIRAVALGLNVWLVLLVLPLLIAGAARSYAWLVLAVPLLPLATGAGALGRNGPAADWLLLGVFPTTLAGVVAALPQLAATEPHSTTSLVLGALSFVAYGAVIALGSSRPARIRRATPTPLGPVAALPDAKRRVIFRRVLLVTSGAAAALLGVLIPAMLDHAELEPAWENAAPEAALLVAVVGGALGATTLSLFVGPSLRASRARPPRATQVRLRVAGLLVAAVLGVLAYVLLVHES